MKKFVAILIALNVFTNPVIAAVADDPRTPSQPSRPADVWDVACNTLCTSLNFEIGCSASSSTCILDPISSYPIDDCLCGDIEAIVDSTPPTIPENPPVNL